MFVAMATVIKIKILSLRGGTAHAHSEIRIAHALMASQDHSQIITNVGPERQSSDYHGRIKCYVRRIQGSHMTFHY